MTHILLRTSLALMVLLSTTALATAAPFTWNPRAVGLNGSKFTADTLVLSDFAQITFQQGGARFTDTGFLPVVGFRLNDRVVTPSGFNQGGWGAYISYVGTGTQSYSPLGLPQTVTFETLEYDLFGYNGAAAFDFNSDGAAIVVGDRISRLTKLATGSLIEGQLNFNQERTILGTVTTTINEVRPQFIQSKPTQFEISLNHPLGEYQILPPALPNSPPTIRIAGGNSSTATLAFKQKGSDDDDDDQDDQRVISVSRAAVAEGSDGAAVEVPEPVSLTLLGTALVAAGLLRRRISRSET